MLPKDVENLVSRMRKETYTSEDDNERVALVLRDFSEGPGNAVNVFRDKATGLTTCITFQTAHMRRMTRKFPESICVTEQTSIGIDCSVSWSRPSSDVELFLSTLWLTGRAG